MIPPTTRHIFCTREWITQKRNLWSYGLVTRKCYNRREFDYDNQAHAEITTRRDAKLRRGIYGPRPINQLHPPPPPLEPGYLNFGYSHQLRLTQTVGLVVGGSGGAAVIKRAIVRNSTMCGVWRLPKRLIAEALPGLARTHGRISA